MAKLKANKPTADVLMNSMRAMGYSFEAAIADIVDNSVSAQARNIVLRFPIDPSDCCVAVCDDGIGMNKKELLDAMKYGSQLKSANRSEDDLGRFGLGMKAASLSQCRRLTVASKKDCKLSAYVWDLDVIEEKKDWYMVDCSKEQIAEIRYIDFLSDKESGTIVLWENFDLIEKSSGNVYAELGKHQNATAEYLSLIFHRYLNGEGRNPLTIMVNNYKLTGLDPFLENHRKTNVRRKIEIPIKDSEGKEQIVSVQPFVLPFQKDLSAEDKRLSGGIENYRAKQGFYIYRNKRLIIWGTWFGRHRDELTKYARIKVDIPNSLDDIWGIDIKKQHATIPAIIRNRLTKAVDEAMDLAVKAQTYRGRVEKVDEKVDYIWDRIKERDNQFVYRINRNSRIFDLLKEKVDDETWNRLDMVLDEIENSVPYQQIYIDKSQNRVDDTVDDERIAEIESKARILIKMSMDKSGERIYVNECEDSIVITNPGSFLPQTVEAVLQPTYNPPFYRNQLLADAMVKFHMIDTATSGIKKVYRIQKEKFFPLPDYNLSNVNQVAVTVYGKILDEKYTQLLYKNNESLDLETVFLLDKIQKHIQITKEQAVRLKKRGLVEGRYPNIYVSFKVASMVGKKAEYVHNKGLDENICRQLILEALKNAPTTQHELLEVLDVGALPGHLSTEQKSRKLSNILQKMKKEGLVKPTGSRRYAVWSLV